MERLCQQEQIASWPENLKKLQNLQGKCIEEAQKYLQIYIKNCQLRWFVGTKTNDNLFCLGYIIGQETVAQDKAHIPKISGHWRLDWDETYNLHVNFEVGKGIDRVKVHLYVMKGENTSQQDLTEAIKLGLWGTYTAKHLKEADSDSVRQQMKDIVSRKAGTELAERINKIWIYFYQGIYGNICEKEK
ncbi:UNKNOWN [Stylonychia lemnae]|uniref:Uncharacterized protein n=1 Tax=Stylonychia lemnae TaxID=5949 RepID=A0A078AUG1_STYLE|nr:UNKNOWN [Stylonychia lemnae]|eukprot:CDW84503.1 UNKNOWN [Stylonychia lemnae]